MSSMASDRVTWTAPGAGALSVIGVLAGVGALLVDISLSSSDKLQHDNNLEQTDTGKTYIGMG